MTFDRKSLRASLAVCALAGAGLLSACGGDNPPVTTSQTTTTTTGPAPMPAPVMPTSSSTTTTTHTQTP